MKEAKGVFKTAFFCSISCAWEWWCVLSREERCCRICSVFLHCYPAQYSRVGTVHHIGVVLASCAIRCFPDRLVTESSGWTMRGGGRLSIWKAYRLIWAAIFSPPRAVSRADSNRSRWNRRRGIRIIFYLRYLLSWIVV